MCFFLTLLDFKSLYRKWETRLHLSILIAFFQAFVACDSSTSTEFQGMWCLVRYEVWDESSQKWLIDSGRISNKGFLMYDGNGHVSVHIQPKEATELNLQIPLDSFSITDLKRIAFLYPRNYVYFGTYTVTDSLVIHTKLSATDPKDVGAQVFRKFQFSGDTLVLTPTEKFNDKTLRLVWRKQ